MSDGIACPGQAAEQLGRSALAQPGHHGGGVGDGSECYEQRTQLHRDLPVVAGEQGVSALSQDAAEAAPAAMDLSSPPALAAGVIQPRSSGAGTADRPSLIIAADQRPYRSAACALARVAADMLIAADADRSGGPFRLDGTVAPAPEAAPGRAGPATPADRAARGDPLAGPGFPADRADRRRALIAAVAQVRGGCCRPPGDLAGPPAVPAWPLRSLVARGADRPGFGGPGDGALLAAGRARADRARRAELAAGAAVGHPGSGASHSAAPAAFPHDLLVLVIASRADTALGTPGVDPLGLAATSTCSLAVTGRAGSADPAGRCIAPQVDRDPAAPGAGRGHDRLIPGIHQRVRQPDQRQRICSRGRHQGTRVLLQ